MRYRIGVEDIEPDHYVAYVFDLPGCFNSAPTLDAAVSQAPARIAAYDSWRRSHDSSLPPLPAPIEVEVAETFAGFASPDDPDYRVNALFEDDRRPLSADEIAVAQHILIWTHADLMQMLDSLGHEQLHQSMNGDTHESIADIMSHVARAENWYLSHLDLALDWNTLPDDPLERLMRVHDHTLAQLPRLAGDSRITEESGERWSVRKIVRRALWHRRDHTKHIGKLAQRPGP